LGTLTTNLKLYKPDPTEFVDPEVQLNRNWDIADAAVRRLLEYEYTNDAMPDIVDSVDRARFYKPYSNSFMAYFRNPNFFYQDPNAFVSTWVPSAAWLSSGWSEQPELPLVHRIVKRTGTSVTEIEWMGAVWKGGAFIDNNVNMTLVEPGTLPTIIRPATNKYFNMFAGNTGTDYGMVRILIHTDGRIEAKRYGVNPGAGSAENRLEFTGIKYSLEVTG
jgi:hypothetical protein